MTDKPFTRDVDEVSLTAAVGPEFSRYLVFQFKVHPPSSANSSPSLFWDSFNYSWKKRTKLLIAFSLNEGSITLMEFNML